MAREKDYEKLLENWPYEYYHMRDPIERKKLLDLASEKGLTPEENEIRRMLWNMRYPDGEQLHAKGEQVVDKFLAAWMYFDFAADRVGAWFGHRNLVKNVKKNLEMMGIEAVKPYGNLGELILYDEYYQLVYHYIHLCETDRNYGSIILGLGKMSSDSYALKVARNLYTTCYKVALGLDMNDEFAILQRAATEAYYDEFPDYQDVYDNVIAHGVD